MRLRPATSPPGNPSVNIRLQEWFQDAKLGIFIHWGLYSVPGWATPTGELGKVDRNVWFKNNPYAEWYLNTVKIESLSAREGSTVQMLDATGDLDWTQEGANLSVTLPTELPGDHAYTLKIIP